MSYHRRQTSDASFAGWLPKTGRLAAVRSIRFGNPTSITQKSAAKISRLAATAGHATMLGR
jgi:hypothetical protein